jgi:hypothetical protein
VRLRRRRAWPAPDLATARALAPDTHGYPYAVIGCACGIGALRPQADGTWRCNACRWTGRLDLDGGRLTQR